MVKNLTTKADVHDAPTPVIENSELNFRKGESGHSLKPPE
jgi:hypothetical protein